MPDFLIGDLYSINEVVH